MKRILTLILILLLLLGIGYAMMSRAGTREWTTDSELALAEFQGGLDALRKFYYSKSSEHFEAALEHDPDFAAPKVWLLYTTWEGENRESRENLLTALRQTDLDALTDRERVLVSYTLAKADNNDELAGELLAQYLATEPGDPYLLMTCSTDAWERQDWDRAQKHYSDLVTADPNWVAAQNRLGYIAMAQGKFDQAEEAFLKYHYIAPDQANPHDSLGELMTLLGRYDEAQVAFETALEIDPDFCLTYYHLVDMYIMSGELEPIGETLATAGRQCSPEFVETMRCATGFWKDFGSQNYEAAFGDDRAECRERADRASPFILHRLAVATDRFDWALDAENRLRRHLAELEDDDLRPNTDGSKGLLLHMEGVRLAAQGDLDEAQAKMLQADDHLLYWGNSQGILKLYNLLNLSSLLRRTGDDRAADAIYEKVSSINPHFAAMVAGDGSLDRQSSAP